MFQQDFSPSIASSASLRNAMLQPEICSDILSERRTGFGPGAFAMASAFHPSSAGERFGPPVPTSFLSVSDNARNLSQSLSGYASSSINAMTSFVAALIPLLRAWPSPQFSVLINLNG